MAKRRSYLFAAGMAAVLVLIVGGVVALTKDGTNAPSRPRENVVLIVVDALRPDHVGAYGYARPVSPAIDAVAAEGALFEQVYSPGAYTAEVVSSFFTGVLPSISPTGTGWYAFPDPQRPTLAETFQANGYRTACFTDHPVLSSAGYGRGFDIHKHFPWIQEWQARGPDVVEAANTFLAETEDDPFFLYIHLVDPHGPYSPPDEFRDLIDVPRDPNPIEVYSEVRPNCPELIAAGFGPGEARFEDMVARYDAEIALSDHCVGQVMDTLDALGLRETTTVIITADHGEEFLEHRFVEHGWTLYNEVLHVPFIIRSPGRLAPQRVSARLSSIGVFPTLMEIAGIDAQRSDLSGVSLLQSDGDALEVRNEEHPIISEIMVQTRNRLRSVMAGDYKLLRWQQYYSPDECARIAPLQPQMKDQLEKGEFIPAPIWGPVVHEELYNLAQDPGEQHNILDDEPARRDELTQLLEAYGQFARETVSSTTPPQAPVKYDAEIEEQMRALGYSR